MDGHGGHPEGGGRQRRPPAPRGWRQAVESGALGSKWEWKEDELSTRIPETATSLHRSDHKGHESHYPCGDEEVGVLACVQKTLGKRRAALPPLPPPTTLALFLCPRYLSDAVWDAVDGAFVSHTPDLVLVSCGFDAGAGEQEGFNVTPTCFGTLVSRLCARAGPAVPVVVVLEGGYEPALLTAAAAQVMGALLAG